MDADYGVRNWFERVKGLEWEPERGAVAPNASCGSSVRLCMLMANSPFFPVAWGFPDGKT